MTEDEVTGLLIEDNPSDAILIATLAESRRARVTLTRAERLDDALALLRRGAFDVVLLDLSLPDARGPESVSRTYATRRDVPIIVLTGVDDEKLAIQAVQAGAQDYLVKGTFDSEVLVKTILYARERKRVEAATQRLVREQAARAGSELAGLRARFLADASRALDSSMDAEEALAELARLAVWVMVDGCMVDLGGREGRMRRVAVLVDGEGEPRAWSQNLEGILPGGANPLSVAMRTNESVDIPALSREALHELRLPPGNDHLLLRSAAVAPMIAGGRTLGALTLISRSPSRAGGGLSASPPLLPESTGSPSLLAVELARRAALAVDNARLYRARELLLEVVSRDLREPLTAILANLPPAGTTSVSQPTVDTLGRATQQMTYMVDDLLDMGRLERGTFALEREPLNLSELLREVARPFRAAAASRDVRLELSAPDALPQLRADRRRLTQALWSLLGSGLHHTPSGGKMELSAETSDDELRVEIANDGPAMGESQLRHLFDRRWQDELPEPRGAGVGLVMARAIIEAHGGRIGAAASNGGNRLFFSLPRSAE